MIEIKISGVLVSTFVTSVLFVSTVLAGGVSTDVLRLSEPVEMGSNYEVFGDPMPNKSAGLSLIDLIDQKQSHLGKGVRVSAKIAQVCQAKGCFFIAMEDEDWVRIIFRDYAFFRDRIVFETKPALPNRPRIQRQLSRRPLFTKVLDYCLVPSDP